MVKEVGDLAHRLNASFQHIQRRATKALHLIDHSFPKRMSLLMHTINMEPGFLYLKFFCFCLLGCTICGLDYVSCLFSISVILFGFYITEVAILEKMGKRREKNISKENCRALKFLQLIVNLFF